MEYKILCTLVATWIVFKKYASEHALAAVLINKEAPDKKLLHKSNLAGELCLIMEYLAFFNILYIIWSF